MSTVVADKSQTIDNSDLCIDCGNCCQVFWVNTAERNAKGEKITLSDRGKKWLNEDIEQITVEEAVELDLINSTPDEIKAAFDYHPTQGLYRCTLFDIESKCCTDYENRPNGCSQFPSYVQTNKNPYKDCALWDQLKIEGKIK